MNQNKTMSKLPNGIRVISYELDSYLMHRGSLHLLLSGRRYSQDPSGVTINVSSSIAFDPVDCHSITGGSQA
jgi:hypothetical protein